MQVSTVLGAIVLVLIIKNEAISAGKFLNVETPIGVFLLYKEQLFWF